MLFLFIASAFFSFFVCFYAEPIGKKLSVIDFPDGKRKLHDLPVPLIGGIAIMIPLIVVSALMSIFTDFTKLYLFLAAAILALFLLGFFDDRRGLPATIRLAISVLFVALVLFNVPGLVVTFLTFSFDSQFVNSGPFFFGLIIGSIFTVVCLVGLQNAVNMADGSNGIVTGMGLVWGLLLISYAPEHILPLLITFVVCIGIVMIFNLVGSLFLGDAGTYGISMMVGLAAIYIYNVNFTALTADKVVLMFLLPIIDTVRLMIHRLVSGRSPLSSDRNHFHHILRLILPPSQTVVIYITLVAGPSLLARFFPDLTWLWLLLVVIIYTIIVVFYFIFLSANQESQYLK